MFDSLGFFLAGRASRMAPQNKFQVYESSRPMYEDKDLKGSDTSSEPEGDSLLNRPDSIMDERQRVSQTHLELIRIVLAVIMSVALTILAMLAFRSSPKLAWEDKDSGLPLMPIPERKSDHSFDKLNLRDF